MDKYQDIIKEEHKITLSEARNWTEELSKVFRAIIAEKDLEIEAAKKLITNLSNSLASRQKFIDSQLTSLISKYKNMEHILAKQGDEIDKLAE